VSDTEGAGTPEQPGTVQLQPWALDVLHLANADGGKKIYGLTLMRNFGERLVFTGAADEVINALQAGIDKIKQLESGIVIAPANVKLPPLNGHPQR
jgi:hypothetical protein